MESVPQYRIEVEQRLTRVEEKVNEIATNHLSHIAADIKELQEGQKGTNLKIAYWTGGATVIGITAQLIIQHYLH